MSEDIESLTPDAAASTEEVTTADTETPTEEGSTEPTAEATADAPQDSDVEPAEAEAAAPEAETAESEAPSAEAEEPTADAASEEGESAEPAASDAAEDAPAEAEAAPAAEPAKPSGEVTSDERPEIAALRTTMKSGELIDGKVIGWNNGGFHVVIGSVAAFCPRSEMEVGKVNEPKSYLDQTLPFRIIKIQQGGKRVVLSRSAAARDQQAQDRQLALDQLEVGAVTSGRVTSLVDFGAFVDIGGVEGLVHVSQIARRKVDKPSDVLELGQEVEVKILKIENGGKRISLSMKALEHDPWTEVADQFPIGTLTEGTVERTANFGAIVELAPSLTGLLPASTLSIPPDSSIARAYPVGKKVSVMVMSVDPRRRRISLALEGATQGGTIADYREYQQSQGGGESGGSFNALASALQKLKGSSE